MAISEMPGNQVLDDKDAEQSAPPPAPAAKSTATGDKREKTPLLVQTWPSRLQEQWQATQVQRARASRGSWVARLASPLGAMALALILIIGLVGFGVGSAINGAGNSTANTSSSSSSSDTMNMGGSTSASAAHVPTATEDYGNQLATYTVDADGAKHFTFTAKQVMWSPLKGVRLLAWTLDGTVPGPMIRVTAGDHVRITIVNHFPEPTAIHWHGLEVPMDADGVPTLGMKAIQPNTTYTYDFVVHDEDAGTHWYHSHYDDMTQVGGGLYGAFIVDPRPGSSEAQQAIHALHADVEYTAFVSHLGAYWTINGKSFPDTQPWLVKHGQTVRIRLIGADPTMMHPMHLHGHTFTIVAEDGRLLAQPIQKDTVQLGPGETYDLTFTAWGKKGDMYPFHCHILTHVMNPGQTGAEMGGLIVAVEYTA